MTPAWEAHRDVALGFFPEESMARAYERPSRVMERVGVREASLYVSVIIYNDSQWDDPSFDPLRIVRIMVVEAGWPLRSLGWNSVSPGVDIEQWHDQTMSKFHAWLNSRAGREVYPVPGSPSTALPGEEPGTPLFPTRPLWPGFLLNTLFYAALLGLLLSLPALRRQIRRRRCLCPACAYPMGNSPVCTECGRELPESILPEA